MEPNMDLEGLSGYSPEVGAELLGKVAEYAKAAAATKNPAQMAQAAALVRRINASRPSHNDSPSRASMRERIKLLPTDIQRGLAEHKLQLVDHTIFVHYVPASSTGFNAFKTDAAIAVGATNITNGMLPSGQPFMVNAIAITAGVYTTGLTALAEQAASAEFAPLSNATYKGVAAGEFDLTCGTKPVLPERYPLSTWKVAQSTSKDYRTGYVELSNPKILDDQKTIKMDFRFPVTLLDRCIIKIELIGQTVVPF